MTYNAGRWTSEEQVLAVDLTVALGSHNNRHMNKAKRDAFHENVTLAAATAPSFCANLSIALDAANY